MSCEVLSKKHIVLLVEAATSRRIIGHGSSSFSWVFKEDGRFAHGTLSIADRAESVKVANMLLRANHKSYLYRYQEQEHIFDFISDEEYSELAHRINVFDSNLKHPVQVIKASRCCRYHSCEHPDYYDTSACAFVESLIARACERLEGYDEALWCVV